MEINLLILNNVKYAEILSNEEILSSLDDALDLIGNISYQGFDKLIIHEKNIIPGFFDLNTKLAGEILQKFVQYQLPICIIGEFSKYNSESLRDFIKESNKGKHVHFYENLEELFLSMS